MFVETNKIIKWFKKWTNLKIKIHLTEKVFYFREKEIWWASLGANIGFEQNGKNENYERPILVLWKFSKDMIWALPLTSKRKDSKYYHDLGLNWESSVILSQLRVISSKRLIRKIGTISSDDFDLIRSKVKMLL